MPRNSAGRFDHLVAFALEHPWAVTRPTLALVASILARRLAGDEPDDAAIAAIAEARATREHALPTGGLVAVIPLFGVIAPRMNLLSEVSGGTTFEALTKQLNSAVADPNVKTIVFDVDSPGGNVAGASEFAREVLRARVVKPVIAQANHLLASAAYWCMSCATEIVASPSSMVGSIGVYGMYDDLTDALSSLGIKREIFSAGKYKAEGVGGLALTDDARVHINGLIGGAYNRFVGDVAKGRGVTAADVRAGYGEGRVLDVDDALAAHLIDRVATLSDTLARVTAPSSSSSRTSGEAPPVVTDPIAGSQERRVAPDPAFVAAEQRLLALSSRGL